MSDDQQILLAIAKSEPTFEMDENLLCEYIEGALSEVQNKQIALLLAQNSSWRQRWVLLKSAQQVAVSNTTRQWHYPLAMAASILLVVGFSFYINVITEKKLSNQIVLNSNVLIPTVNKSDALAYQGILPEQWKVFIDTLENPLNTQPKLTEELILFRDLATEFNNNCSQPDKIDDLLKRFEVNYPLDYQAIIKRSGHLSNNCDMEVFMTQYARMSVK
jgi:hypothetical protein